MTVVAILGCGPSGLLAAHACELYDKPFIIFSRKIKSKLGGAQYSHVPIPLLHNEEDPRASLRIVIKGTAEEYHRKVYGTMKVPFVSFDYYKSRLNVPAWSLTDAYDTLWERYERNIIQTDIGPGFVAAMNTDKLWSHVFSSVPLTAICRAREDAFVDHQFRSVTVRILQKAMVPTMDEDVMIYNGEKEPSWYRMSKIFGVGSTEWGAGSPVPPVSDLRSVTKPIDTNCDCHPHVVRIGRYGTWQKGELSYHAFNRVVEVLTGEQDSV